MKKNTVKLIIFVTAVLTAVLVPCLALFQEGNWLSYVLADTAMHKEWYETGILAVLLILNCLFIKSRKVLFPVLAGILLIMAYLHSMLIPLILAGVWFFILMLTGDLITGIASAIVSAGILSLFGLCTPVNVFLATLAAQLVFCLPGRRKKRFLTGKKRISYSFCRFAGMPLSERLLAALTVLVLLIQIGRANECIDFDSLWYGVRSLYVLVPGGSIFEDLGLVGMVYTYPKGFEILTLPLDMTESYAVISAFNLFLFVYGLFVTARIAGCLTGDPGNDGGSGPGPGREPEITDAVSADGPVCGAVPARSVTPWRKLAVLLTVLVPGIVNMTLSAKPDIITWVLQLVMLGRFFAAAGSGHSGEREESRTVQALSVISVYLLSLTMKPTALIFSTALFGMMFLWTLYRAAAGRRELPFRRRGPFLRAGDTVGTVLSSAALAVVWGRTVKLTGMPVTSVFTGVLEKLGFTMKYPFTSRSLPASCQEGSQLIVALKRVFRMLLMPVGKDMSHVIIAWGGSLFFVLGVMILWNLAALIRSARNEKKRKTAGSGAGGDPAERTGKPQALSGKISSSPERSGGSFVFPAALVIFLPFLLVCFATLTMLYQVDGNYYMILYSIVIFLAVAFERQGCSLPGENRAGRQGCFLPGENSRPPRTVHRGTSRMQCKEMYLSAGALAVILSFQFLIMTMTNWAGVAGFTEIQENSGLYSHRAYYKEQLTQTDGSLYDILSADPSARVVAFGEHPVCLQFPCIVQSYNDITSPWGNVEIVNSADAFISYLHFAKVDYVYGDAAHLEGEAWQWSRGLIDELTARGVLTDFIYEGENWIARVNG